jgi:FKBP-type peptidyl-prolyl cis-trans isomerase FkpA
LASPFSVQDVLMKTLFSPFIFGLVLGFAAQPATAATPAAPVVKVPKVLIKTDHVEGKGRMADTGSTVTIHYTGWLYSPTSPKQRGSKFDSSVDGAPFTFKLGAGAVIKGWEEGVRGMRVGGKRTLIVPASMGFGKDGLGPVPTTANLLFDIELMDVK